MEGLGNEVPFFVLRYKPEWEPTVDEELSRRRCRPALRGAPLVSTCAHAFAVELPAAPAGECADGCDFPGVVPPVAVHAFGARPLRSNLPGQLLPGF